MPPTTKPLVPPSGCGPKEITAAVTIPLVKAPIWAGEIATSETNAIPEIHADLLSSHLSSSELVLEVHPPVLPFDLLLTPSQVCSPLLPPTGHFDLAKRGIIRSRSLIGIGH